ncbi:hypothetical protein [Hymenobacter fodinae]|uniref:Uncharacterized protein n=1 Tax=Hymenobacter fodinae TaxID=2510796 RepID=A0A4Z0P347_9BACT|nr:hypothetical protein [Hymenobacter fodinae]TGE06064.1 hypothetical protein EU556_14440 [Hymenobacter fodinae]
MKYSFLVAVLCSIGGWQQVTAQTTKTQALEQGILREGLALYESERASWIATDLLMARQPDMTGVVGYLSYADQDSVSTIFLHQASDKQALAVKYGFTFARTSILPATSRNISARPASAREERLFAMRLLVMDELRSHKLLKSAYGFPENTRPNVVILDDNQGARAYILTGTQEEGILPIGNDFLMSFTSAGKLSKVERLHNSYIPMRLPEGDQTIEAGMHSHLSAHPYITPTDICSLLLYQNAFPAKQHLVMSNEYVSIFDLPKRQLAFLTRKAFDKIYKDQQKRHPSSE